MAVTVNDEARTANQTMQIVREVAYGNPNLLLPVPAIFLAIRRQGGFADLTGEKIATFLQTAGTVIPALGSMLTEALQRLSQVPMPAAVGECVGIVALSLQRDYLYPAERAGGLAQASQDQVGAVFECHHQRLGALAGRAAVEICAEAFALAEVQPTALKAIYEKFKAEAGAVVPVLATRLILKEAFARDIPAHDLFDLDHSIVRFRETIQLGQGVKQTRILGSLSSRTSEMACEFASYKSTGSRIFAEYGIPVARNGLADTEAQALEIARKIGFPLVVKPNAQHRGVGVHTGIVDEDGVKRAFADASQYGAIQIESHLPGFDHRITFIGNALVGVVRVMPPSILGDGGASIQQLLEVGRVTTPKSIRGKIIVDEEVLDHVRKSGYQLDDILPAGEQIVLRSWWRNHQDYAIEDVTPSAHPENIDVARLAVQLLGLDVAGVDFITTDIARPYYETGGGVTEVNPMPALTGAESCGLPAHRMLLEMLFAKGNDGRIPTALMLGTRDDGMTIDLAAEFMTKSGVAVGVGTRDRLDVAGRAIRRRLATDAERASLILRDPQSAAAILQTSEDVVARSGMPIDRCDVGVILLPAEPTGDGAPARRALDSARLLIALARKSVILNTSDPRAAALLSAANGKRLIWIQDDLNAAADKLRRPGDKLVAIRQMDGRHFVSVLDGQAMRKLFPAPKELVQAGSATAPLRRIVLVAVATAFELGASAQHISAIVQSHGGRFVRGQ